MRIVAKSKEAIAGSIALVIGAVTLRTVRRRRRGPREEAEIAAKESLDEASEAVEHTTTALGQAFVASKHAAEAANDEFGGDPESVEVEQSPSRAERMRNAAGSVIRL